MTANPKLRLLSDLKQGDRVRTPSGAHAIVHSFYAGRVELKYCADGEEVSLRPELLEFVAHGPERPFPPRFFHDSVKKAKGAA